MTAALLVVFLVGLVLGGAAGRRWAEFSRARHDMANVWSNRRNYRR